MTLPDGVLRACIDRLESEFAIVEADGTILYTNEAWQRFAVTGGFPGDPAMIGENYFEAIRAAREEDRYAAEACDGFDELVSGQREVFRLEYPCPSPDDPFRWFMMWASPIGFGDESYVVIEHVEITERVKTAQRLQWRNEMLESVGSILSHDLRNPMAAAIGWGQAIQAAADPNPEHIDRMVGSLERMDAMIDDAIFLARGLLVEETEAVSVESVASLAWEAVAPETATLDVRTDARIDADPTLLQTLFENLFRNSIEHGSEDVTVTVGSLEEGFYVEDDGPGVPEDRRELVFNTGYTTRSAAGNTGMGLAIVEGVVRAHEWNVDLVAADSGGARFEISGVRPQLDADADPHAGEQSDQ